MKHISSVSTHEPKVGRVFLENIVLRALLTRKLVPAGVTALTQADKSTGIVSQDTTALRYMLMYDSVKNKMCRADCSISWVNQRIAFCAQNTLLYWLSRANSPKLAPVLP